MMDQKHCSGCENDFYNRNDMGMNMESGKPQCWSLKDATLVKARDVPTQMRPPYLTLPMVSRPNCYKAKGYVRVKTDALTSEGYWR